MRCIALRRAIGILAACALLLPLPSLAQGNQAQLRLGIGTFITHDRGWNYSQPIDFFAAVTRHAGSVDVEAAATFSKSFAHFSQPAIYPPAPSPFRDGFRARLGLRAPSAARRAISALIGAELVQNRTDDDRTWTAAATAGVGLAFGSDRRGTIEMGYSRFATPLGSSRGIMPLTLGWQL